MKLTGGTMATLKLAYGLDVQELSAEYEGKSAQEVIHWTLDTFGSGVAICTSFQAEGMVILDIAHRIDPEVRVFTIDTGRLPQETYDLIDRVRERYGISVEVYYPDPHELTQMVNKHGVNPFYRSVSLRLLCCEIRKVIPLKRVLRNLDAWIAGLTRSQGRTRGGIGKIEMDIAHDNIIKVNPLADWSPEQIWEYIRANQVPYNELYDKGYASIGCAPCTRPIRAEEDLRAGRWWWEKGVPKECGIHMSPAWQKATVVDIEFLDKERS